MNYTSNKEVKNDDYIYKTEISRNFVKSELVIVDSVNKKSDKNGNITSSAGMKTNTNPNKNWQPMPAVIPQEETNPSAIKIPSFDVDWEKTAYGVGAGLLIGTVVIGAIILAPETSGMSLGVIALV